MEIDFCQLMNMFQKLPVLFSDDNVWVVWCDVVFGWGQSYICESAGSSVLL